MSSRADENQEEPEDTGHEDVASPEVMEAPEALVATLAAIMSWRSPRVARATSEYLKMHTRMLELQVKHLETEHPLQLAYLGNQIREERLRRLGLRLRVGFQICIAIGIAVVLAGVAIVVWEATTMRRVVVEPFHTPPALAAGGIDGVVVASELQDKMRYLQSATRTSGTPATPKSAAITATKLEIPGSGISISDLTRMLKDIFGHDMKIDGELVQTPSGGLKLTVRGSGVPPMSFIGLSNNRDKIFTSAAEYLFSKAQPANWAVYLNSQGRYSESIDFCKQIVPTVEPAIKHNIFVTWGTAVRESGGSIQEDLRLLNAALRVKPNYWVAYNNEQSDLIALGEEEAAWQDGERMRMAAGGRAGKAPEIYYQNWDYLTWNLVSWLAALTNDAKRTNGVGSDIGGVGPAIADVLVRQHDLDGAELALDTTNAVRLDPDTSALLHFARGRMDAEAGDMRAAQKEMSAFGKAFSNPAVSTNYAGYDCWIAPIEEAAGNSKKADAILSAGGHHVDCLRFRGDILDHRGDWVNAQRAYASSVSIAPHLPAGYYSWGVALAKHGDLLGAADKLKVASALGPHWADPLKAWGDVLVRQGQWKAALEKYDDALKLAPAWREVGAAREVAAKAARASPA